MSLKLTQSFVVQGFDAWLSAITPRLLKQRALYHVMTMPCTGEKSLYIV